ncbi:MAG TPA: hypothetical protein VFO23_11775, partial [Steroidobacteraceae bacterium]|nr:hypothetical protein [Steroidobacteraceae bacterium]
MRYADRSPALVLAAAAVLAGGCAVGPDFKKPAPPAVSAYTPAPVPATIPGVSEATVPGGG